MFSQLIDDIFKKRLDAVKGVVQNFSESSRQNVTIQNTPGIESIHTFSLETLGSLHVKEVTLIRDGTYYLILCQCIEPDDFEVLFYNEDIEDLGFPGVPTYIPVEQVPSGYARLLYGRVPVHTFNRTQNNAWLHQAMPANPVWINDEAAKTMGLADGDEVAFINSEGMKSRTTTIVKTTPGLRKDCVYMAHGYGSANSLMTIGAVPE